MSTEERLWTCQRPCLRTSCTKRCAGCQFHDGEHRCLGHAREVALRRQATITRGVQRAAREVMKTWPKASTPPPHPAPPTPPHEDPIIQKIVLDGHGPIGVYAKNQAGNLTAADVAESYRIAKGAELVFSVQKNRSGGQSFRQGLIAAEEVLNGKLARSRNTAWSVAEKSLVETVLGDCITELGRLCVEDNKDEMRKGLPLYDSDRTTVEIRNLVEPVAQGLFADGKYAAEMAIRGLLVRTERLVETEASLASSRKASDEWSRRALEAEGRLKATYERMEAKTRFNEQLGVTVKELRLKLDALPEMQVIKGLQTQVDRLKKENAELDRLRKKHFKEAVETKAKLDVRTDATTWASSDGRKLLPREFEASHLMNTIRYIERLPARGPRDIICDYDGDAAPLMDDGEPEGIERFKVYPLLLKEARKRGFLLCHDRIKGTVPAGTIFTEEPNT